MHDLIERLDALTEKKGEPEKEKKPKLGTGERFKKLSGELEKKGAKDPKALAAYIGRKKYGKKKFAQLGAKGKSEDVLEETASVAIKKYGVAATNLLVASKNLMRDGHDKVARSIFNNSLSMLQDQGATWGEIQPLIDLAGQQHEQARANG